jgi:hypothetical protein
MTQGCSSKTTTEIYNGIKQLKSPCLDKEILVVYQVFMGDAGIEPATPSV